MSTKNGLYLSSRFYEIYFCSEKLHIFFNIYIKS